MPLSKKNLFIKRSGIPGAGKGLFTKIFIVKGDLIVEYKGRITTWKKVLEANCFNGYVFYINRNHVIDAKPYLKAFGKYANDADGLRKIKGLVNNSKYVNEGGRIFIKAIKDIPAGSEILVNYKKEYWDVIKYNSRFISNKMPA